MMIVIIIIFHNLFCPVLSNYCPLHPESWLLSSETAFVWALGIASYHLDKPEHGSWQVSLAKVKDDGDNHDHDDDFGDYDYRNDGGIINSVRFLQ